MEAMSDGGTYRIGSTDFKPGEMCECGHPIGAHGSKGMVCCACPCRQFVIRFDPKEPKFSRIP